MLPSTFLKFSRSFNLISSKCVTSPSFVRLQSTASKDLVLLDVNDKTGFATMTMNSPPVNTLNLDLLSAMSKSLDILDKNNTRGMILTSSCKTTFSAGLDINELYNRDKERMREFWRTLQDVWIKLYGTKYPTAAAINGHAPAGGCLLSMSCEYRVMLPKYSIGLNETQLGIVAPSWFMATMKNTISARDSELALTLGTLFKTDHALRIGMIDDIVDTKAQAIEKCEEFLQKYQKVPSEARTLTKLAFRGNDIKELQATREKDVELFVNFVSEKGIQKKLGLIVRVMKVRKMLKNITKPFGAIAKMFGGGKSKKAKKN